MGRRKKITSTTDQRHFSMIYHDSLDSDRLEGTHEKMLFIALKRFADSDNKCFPSLQKLAQITGMSKKYVIQKLKALEEKGIIKSESRFRSDGGYSSNLYTIYDYANMWNPDNSNYDVADITKWHDLEEAKKLLEESGLYDVKAKELTTEPTKVTEVSSKLNQFDIVNTTLNSRESQAERYTIDQIRQIYDYEILIHDYPILKDYINSVMEILHSSLNTTKPTIRIGKEDKPTMVVIGKLMKLTYLGIKYAIDKFKEQTERITNPRAYMLTILYNAEEQQHLDTANRVAHDMAHWNNDK